VSDVPAQPPPDEIEIGWQVIDPDGNVVQSGPISKAHAAAWVGELIEAARNEGAQE